MRQVFYSWINKKYIYIKYIRLAVFVLILILGLLQIRKFYTFSIIYILYIYTLFDNFRHNSITDEVDIPINNKVEFKYIIMSIIMMMMMCIGWD